MDEDDAGLVRRSQGGDMEAFGALVTRYETQVISLVGHVLGTSASTSAVEETAMDVFARAWRDLLLLGDDKAFADWLTRIAVETAPARTRHPPSGIKEPADTLPGPERVAVRLYFTGGLSAEDISCRTGCSVPVVWTRLADGCRRMGMGGRDGMYGTWLLPALEGVLDDERHTELQERLGDDPALAAEMSRLRRALPGLRARLTPRSPIGSVSLWPHLRGRLTQTRRRHVRPALARFAVGVLLLAVLLPLTSADQHIAFRRGVQADVRWRRALHRAPPVVFYRDNALGTRTAAGLEARVRREAVQHRAEDIPPGMLASRRHPQRSDDDLTF